MPITGNAYQDQNYGGEAIGQLLNLVLSGATAIKQGNRDKAYRNAFAKEMGIDPSSLEGMERADLNELRKEKYKALLNPKEYKPQTEEAAIRLAVAKKGASKTFEEEIKSAVASGQPLDKEQTNYYNTFLKKSGDMPIEYINPNAPTTVSVTPVAQKGPGIGGILRSILGAASQVGNNMNPVAGFINMISPQTRAVTTPVPTTVPETVAQPGAVAPAAAPVADPIALRIKQAIDGGMDPQEVKRQLIEKGIDPAKYGL